MGSHWVAGFIKNINSHLAQFPDTPDHVLLVLKAHLLIEQGLERLLRSKLPNPELVLDDHTKFVHKLRMLKALIPNPLYITNVWELVQELNVIRNDLAHELTSENI
ncbi:MAG: hypothetical protein ISS70_26040 [Phycisphaerae bacterium]|nr:hypothetical protein [Phycisphaerae bacterium]